MQVNALDHINIITDDLKGTSEFYARLLKLDVRDAPPPLTPQNAQWLYDDNGRAVIHLNTPRARSVNRPTPQGGHTGAVHHIAFDCSGAAEMESYLKAEKIDYHHNFVEAISLTQLFLEDPSGVLLELNFRGEKLDIPVMMG